MKRGKDLKVVSRLLRKGQTPWEAKLWYYLRGGRFRQLKFKRQVPTGKCIVDFCCQEKKLIIELDGGQHNINEIHKIDLERDKFLKENGYTVLRFWNNEIDNNLEGVMEVISRVIIN